MSLLLDDSDLEDRFIVEVTDLSFKETIEPSPIHKSVAIVDLRKETLDDTSMYLFIALLTTTVLL